MYIADEPVAAYGIYLNVGNGIPMNLISNHGTVAAIGDEIGVSGINWHPEYSPGIIDYGHTGTYIYPDLDSSIGFSFNAQYSGGNAQISVVAPMGEYNGIPRQYGEVNYYSGTPTGQTISIVSPTCRTYPGSTSSFDYFSSQGSLDGAISSSLTNPFDVHRDVLCWDQSRTVYDREMNATEITADNASLSLGTGNSGNSNYMAFNRGGVGWTAGSTGVGPGTGLYGGSGRTVSLSPNSSGVGGSNSAFGCVYSGNNSGSGGGLCFEAQSTAIASASAIAPTFPVHHITGTTTISTITVPSNCAFSGWDCNVGLIADGAWATGTSGNIAVAMTATVGYRYDFTYDPGTSKWYLKF